MTDNGKVFTARFGQGPGPVLFDRICANNGIRHLLTAPYSPTTTGKVERFHKTMRSDFLVDHDRVHATIEELQAPSMHGSPSTTRSDHISRWAIAHRSNDSLWPLRPTPPTSRCQESRRGPLSQRPPGVNRWVDQRGSITLGGFAIGWDRPSPGEPVEVVVRQGLVEILHAGVLVATHAERRRQRRDQRRNVLHARDAPGRRPRA